jgi:3-oxoacyl-[acyl-carrier protein] reductase
MIDLPITLITGSRKGIGRSLAEHYLERHHFVVGCSREATDLAHANYLHFQCDISDENAVKNLFKEIRLKFKRLDHLINNAGIAAMNHTITTPLSTVRKVVDTNIIGTFLFCREAAKIMQSRKYGRIVNFSTVATPLKLEGEAVYAASKAAVLSLTQIMAKEFADFNITVNAVGPTPIQTDLIRSVPQDKIDKILEQQSIHRFGEFADVANVIDFFLSRNSNFITGQTLFLGGV